MKRIASILLLLAMLLTLTACGGKGDSTSAGKPNTGAVSGTGSKNDKKDEKKPAGPVEIVDHVKAAMEANRHLTTSNYLLAKDGTIIAMREETNDEAAMIYAKMPNVKELCVSASSFDVFALTDDNTLYYAGNKLMDNVTALAYASTNSNEAGRILSGSEIFRHDSMGLLDNNVNKYFLQRKADSKTEITGTPVFIGVDKHDFVVITETGDIYMDASGDAYNGHELFNWTNMAMVDIARDVESGELVSLTAAGIQGDGTVVASGDYAADILSWGELSYIAMNDTVIAGLKKDGTVKVTGLVGANMQDIVAGWSNIVAIEAGYGARFGNFVSAMDADGNFYYARFYQNSYTGCKVSVDEGVSPRVQARKYTPDGKAFYVNSEGVWEEDTND